jgi:pyruvate formate lyase activating enzyme
LKWSSFKISSEDVLKEVTKDREYYDVSGGGVTLSGGEPLKQFKFCLDFIVKAKSLDLHLAVDTSGFIQTELFEKIIQYVDLFLYDIKFIDTALHYKYTGQSNNLILTNFQKIYEANKKIVVRVPLIPGITDKKENLLQINKFVKTYSNKIRIQQIPFNNLMRDKYIMLGKDCAIIN